MISGQAGSQVCCGSCSTTIWNQEMERRGHVVLGYLRWYGESIETELLSSASQEVTSHSTLFFLSHCSAPFAVIPSMSHRLNIKPIPLPPTTMDCRLPLEIVVTSFIWIAFSVGSRRGQSVHFVTRNGTLPRLNEFLAMDNWESKNIDYFICVFGMEWKWGLRICKHCLLFTIHYYNNHHSAWFWYRLSREMSPSNYREKYQKFSGLWGPSIKAS